MVEVGDYLRPLMLKDLRVQCRARGLNPGGGREALAERLGEHMLATQDFTMFADVNAPGAGGGPTSASGYAMPGMAPDESSLRNNYSRPSGQNVGNHITDRSSSRVLAPPGGQSQIQFGDSPPRQAQHPALADVSNQDTRGPSASPREMAPKSPTLGRESAHDAASVMYPSYHKGQYRGMAPKSPAGRNPTATSLDFLRGSPQHQSHFSGHGMSGGAGVEVNNYSRPNGQNVGNFLSDRPSSRVVAPPGGASQITFG